MLTRQRKKSALCFSLLCQIWRNLPVTSFEFYDVIVLSQSSLHPIGAHYSYAVLSRRNLIYSYNSVILSPYRWGTCRYLGCGTNDYRGVGGEITHIRMGFPYSYWANSIITKTKHTLTRQRKKSPLCFSLPCQIWWNSAAMPSEFYGVNFHLSLFKRIVLPLFYSVIIVLLFHPCMCGETVVVSYVITRGYKEVS